MECLLFLKIPPCFGSSVTTKWTTSLRHTPQHHEYHKTLKWPHKVWKINDFTGHEERKIEHTIKRFWFYSCYSRTYFASPMSPSFVSHFAVRKTFGVLTSLWTIFLPWRYWKNIKWRHLYLTYISVFLLVTMA